MIAQKISVRTGEALNTYLDHVVVGGLFLCSSRHNVPVSLCSYNHRRDRFPGLCSLRPFLQTRCWNQLKNKRLGVSL